MAVGKSLVAADLMMCSQRVHRHVNVYEFALALALAGTRIGLLLYMYLCAVNVPIQKRDCSQDPVPPHSSTSPHVFYQQAGLQDCKFQQRAGLGICTARGWERSQKKKNDRHGRNHLFPVLYFPCVFLHVSQSLLFLILSLLFFLCLSLIDYFSLIEFLALVCVHISGAWLFVFLVLVFVSAAPSLLPSICSRSRPHFVSVSVSVTLSSCSVTPKPQHSHYSKHLGDKSCGLNNGFRLPQDKITHSPPPLHTHIHTQTLTLINNRMKFPNYNEVCDSWLGLPVINVNTFPLGNYEHISTL